VNVPVHSLLRVNRTVVLYPEIKIKEDSRLCGSFQLGEILQIDVLQECLFKFWLGPRSAANDWTDGALRNETRYLSF
jgi:hypothetical protein